MRAVLSDVPRSDVFGGCGHGYVASFVRSCSYTTTGTEKIGGDCFRAEEEKV